MRTSMPWASVLPRLRHGSYECLSLRSVSVDSARPFHWVLWSVFPSADFLLFLHGHGLHCTLDMIYDVSLHSSRPGVNMSDLGRRAAALHLMPISCKQQWGEALFWKMLLSFHRMRWTCGLCLLEQPLGMPRRVLAQRPLDDFLWDRLFPYERLCLVLNSTKDHA